MPPKSSRNNRPDQTFESEAGNLDTGGTLPGRSQGESSDSLRSLHTARAGESPGPTVTTGGLGSIDSQIRSQSSIIAVQTPFRVITELTRGGNYPA